MKLKHSSRSYFHLSPRWLFSACQFLSVALVVFFLFAHSLLFIFIWIRSLPWRERSRARTHTHTPAHPEYCTNRFFIWIPHGYAIPIVFVVVALGVITKKSLQFYLLREKKPSKIIIWRHCCFYASAFPWRFPLSPCVCGKFLLLVVGVHVANITAISLKWHMNDYKLLLLLFFCCNIV